MLGIEERERILKTGLQGPKPLSHSLLWMALTQHKTHIVDKL